MLFEDGIVTFLGYHTPLLWGIWRALEILTGRLDCFGEFSRLPNQLSAPGAVKQMLFEELQILP
jgi:hypothetical protein